MVITRPRPTLEGLGFYYDNAYSGQSEEATRHFQLSSRLGRWISRYRLAVLAKVRPLSPADHLLDVGCSYGGLIKAAVEASGCKASGVDLDEGSIRRAYQPSAGPPVAYHHGTLDDLDAPPGGLSVITFMESLEHHPDPMAALRRAASLLAEGGLCFVEVPNFNGLWRRVFGRFWLPLLIPQHLTHFTPQSLAAMMRAAGFEVRHQQTMFYPLEGVASLGLALAQCLRTPPFGAPPSWRTPFDILVFLLLLALYFVFEIPSQALLHLLGLSGHQAAIGALKGSSDEQPRK